MVSFERRILSNGLRVLVHEDPYTPLAAVNVAYFVGSRDEQPNRTGFAHLFEHLMFSGSRNAPNFDNLLQSAGGENNAYTTNDYTTFYEILPAQNIETALFLESDRMLDLRITRRALETQRRVVIEEFKETCLSEPYGDMLHHLSDMLYRVHPYRWPVIGLSPDHIAKATLEEVRTFYEQWYVPNNAVLSICGPLKADEAFALAEKWFGGIPPGPEPKHVIPEEPLQIALVERTVEANVPVPAVFMAFRTPPRLHPDFYPTDLLSDVLAMGQSARLYRALVKEQPLLASVDASVTANFDPGMLLIEAKLNEGVTPQQAIEAIWNVLNELVDKPISERELAKIRHRFESTVIYSETSVLNKAQYLGFYEILERAELLNQEVDTYRTVDAEHMQRVARALFRPENAAVLIYQPRLAA
ncbi:MAG: insulinase family protein [Saprospiraceae bacterium]|nr:insulinase family protein [Saprospiraceae bacterium]MDW8483561.1 pitrilysin family protein [Saprospiraceae bacterium]